MIRVLLVDDHQMVREGIAVVVSREDDITVAGEAASGRGAIEFFDRHGCDVVLMDTEMPGMNGIVATQHITGMHLAKVLAVSESADHRVVSAMLAAGAAGYILKLRSGTELVEAIRTVHDGNVFLCPQVARTVVQSYRGGRGAEPAAPALTPREGEVLQLLCEGHSGKAIAHDLGVTTRTIDTYRHNIMKKLHITSLAGLVKYAIREGLTSLDD